MVVSSYSLIGNSLHMLILTNTVLYGSIIYRFGAHHNDNDNDDDDDNNPVFFDPEWLERGFCTPHNNFDGQTTHDYSGYAIVSIALIGIAIQQVLSRQSSRNSSSDSGAANASSRKDTTTSTTTTTTTITTTRQQQIDQRVLFALLGALGHGWGHLFIAHGIRGRFYPPAKQTFLQDLIESPSIGSAIGKAVPGYPLFWMPLVATYMQNTAKNRIAFIALLCWLGSLLMQVRFGFSYTQSVLFAGMSLDQLMLPDHQKIGFEYALWPFLTTIPNSVLGWIEATTCTTNPLLIQHGHVVYDVVMATSYIVYYLICWFLIHNNKYNWNSRTTTIKSKTL